MYAGKPYTSGSISADAVHLTEDVTRADIEFYGLDSSRASYEGRVFVNNPEADENTPPTPDSGYAGSFYVFGIHGGHYGHVSHGEVRAGQPAYDPRRPHAAPAKMRVTATDALKRVVRAGEDVTITVVPVNVVTMPEQGDTQDVLRFDRLSIVTYRAEGPGEQPPEYQPEHAPAPSMPTSRPQPMSESGA